jgi:membrane dipeptidase
LIRNWSTMTIMLPSDRSYCSRAHRSRRQFLTTAGAAGAAMLLRPAWLHAAGYEQDPRVAQILSRVISVDVHNHVFPPGTEPHPDQPRPGEPPPAPSLPLARELKRSGLTAVCASFGLDFTSINKPGEALANYLHWLSAIDAELQQSHIHRALNRKDLQVAHDHGQPTIVQTVEGAMFIEGRLDRIEQVYKRGVRNLQLLHERDDLVSPLGDVITAPPHLGGLTAFGAEVVKECNRLGILVDLAHASPQTVLGALKVATKPILVSHTGLDTQTGSDPKMAAIMKPHLISKEHAKVVAEAAGVVGVWTKLAGSPKEFVANIQAMVDAIGVDHVAIGTDSDLLSARAGQGTNLSWPSMTDGSEGFFPTVVAEMLVQGFSTEEIAKVSGGNYCRIFEKATGVEKATGGEKATAGHS